MRNIIFAIYIVALLQICTFSFKHAAYNWDMLAYMAVVTSDENTNFSVVHDSVYAYAKRYIPAEQYLLLTDPNNSYRNRMKIDAQAFRQELPNYAVKPLYTKLIYFFYRMGVNIVNATILPSVLSLFLIGIIMFYWLRKYMPGWPTFAVSLMLILTVPLLSVSKLSTPDCLSALLLLISMFFIVEKGNFLFSFVFLLLAVFVRIDNAIAAVVFISLITFSSPSGQKLATHKSVMMLLSIGLCYFIVSSGTGKFGWDIYSPSTYYQYMFMGQNFKGGLFPNGFTAFINSLALDVSFFSHFRIFLFLLVLVIANAEPARSGKLSFDRLFAIAILLIFTIRYFLRPVIEDRFYIAYYLVIAVLLVRRFSVTDVNINKFIQID